MSVKLDVNEYMKSEARDITSFELSQMFGWKTNRVHSLLAQLEKTGFVKKNGHKKVQGKRDATLWIHTGRKSQPSSHPKLNITQKVLDFILSAHVVYTRTDIAKYFDVSHNVIYLATNKLIEKGLIKIERIKGFKNVPVDILYTGLMPAEYYHESD